MGSEIKKSILNWFGINGICVLNDPVAVKQELFPFINFCDELLEFVIIILIAQPIMQAGIQDGKPVFQVVLHSYFFTLSSSMQELF